MTMSAIGIEDISEGCLREPEHVISDVSARLFTSTPEQGPVVLVAPPLATCGDRRSAVAAVC